jgi:hypothetical protein
MEPTTRPPASAGDLLTTDGQPSAELPPAAAAAVPGYALGPVLGRGGMGVVYRATQTALNRPAAVKVLLGGGHAGPREVERLKAEAVVVVTAAARGVAAAHAAGVVHRDLKPGNVLFAADGTPKVADFGLAKRADGGNRTATFAVLGKPNYMAPEQADGKAKGVGPAADVWALGAVLYECLTGRPPFAGDTMLETLDRVRFGKLTPPRRLVPGVPPAVEAVVLRCLRRKPAERFADGAAVVEALAGGEATTRPRRRVMVAVVGLSLGGVAVGGWLTTTLQRPGVLASPSEESPGQPARAIVSGLIPPEDQATAAAGLEWYTPSEPRAFEFVEGTGFGLILTTSADQGLEPLLSKDVEGWGQALSGLVPPANLGRLRLGGRTTPALLRRELAAFFKRPTAADTLILVVSGHGFSAGGRTSLTDFVPASDLDLAGLPAMSVYGDEIAALLGGCPARVKLVFWDVYRDAGDVPVPAGDPRAWDKVPNCAVVYGCSDGQTCLADPDVGSYLSAAATRVLGRLGADGTVDRWTHASFSAAIQAEFFNLARDRAAVGGNDDVAVALRDGTLQNPDVVGTLAKTTPLFRVVRRSELAPPPRPVP